MTRLTLTLCLAILFAGCLRPHTRITIPAQALNPAAPVDAPPATYYSERDFSLRIQTTDGATVELTGEASPVLSAKGNAISGIITASGQIIPATVPAP